jgi:sugar/nucleoside kinase (ribokinase family)
MASVLGFGSALLDQLAYVSEDFLRTLPGQKGGMVLVEPSEQRRLLESLPVQPTVAPGGSAANTVVGLARLGVSARLLAKTGADRAGDEYRRHLAAAGVDTVALKRTAALPTGTCLSLITPDGERTLRTCLGAAAELSAEEVGQADVAGCTHFMMEGYMLHNRSLSLHVLRLARAAGCRIAIDLASPELVQTSSDLLPGLLEQYADMVFANAQEATAFTGSTDPEQAVRLLAGLCPLAAVKVGADGAFLQRGGDVVYVPAERVTARDTTGAGDLWAAGFLYGCIHGRSLATAGRMGAAVAAAVVQVVGAAMPETAWDVVRARLAALREES